MKLKVVSGIFGNQTNPKISGANVVMTYAGVFLAPLSR